MRNNIQMNLPTKHLFILILALFSKSVIGQDGFIDGPRGLKGVRVMFYNCENLFDAEDDSLTNDADFLPSGNYNWTKYRYWEKLERVSKVITAVGGWEAPALVGLCEIENRHVLINMAHQSSLKSHKYSIAHYESPDIRGIDVALLYRPEKFWLVSSKPIHIQFPFDTTSKTRDILYVKGIVLDQDTLHVFVNHWPSRLGGQAASQVRRNYVASVLKQYTDSILKVDSCAKILIMGDFNDNPTDESILSVLKAMPTSTIQNNGLVDLMNSNENPLKTHFYRGSTGVEWSTLDQIIVSSSLYGKCEGLNASQANAFKADFLFEEDESANKIPKRTFIGMKYNAGFSDHLPVFIDLLFNR